jgi:hypothetical protein
LVQLYGNFKTKVFLLLGYIVLLLFSFALVWFECFSFSWYMGFELKTRQVLYHLSHPPSSHFFPFFFFFALAIFGIGSPIYAGAGVNHDSPTYLSSSWDDRPSPPYPANWLRWSLDIFFPRLASNHNPPAFHLPSIWDYSMNHQAQPVPSHFLIQ